MTANLVLILIAVISAAFFYHRTQPPLPRGRAIFLAALRSVTLAIALMLLISPILRYIRTFTMKQELFLLMDRSASMKNDGKAEWMKAQARLLEKKYQDAGYKILNYSFARGLDGDAKDTQLAPALKALAAKHDLSKAAGILLFSDGWLRDEDLSFVHQTSIPIMPVIDSSSVKMPDLAVENLRNNRHSYRGEPTLFKADLKARDYSGPATVKLMSGKQMLASKTIELKSDEPQQVEFTHRFPTVGFHPLSVEVSANQLPEKEMGNNFFPGAIEILAEKERILIISDQAGWDNKFIMDVIAANVRWQSQSYILQDGILKLGEKVVAGFDRENNAAIVVVNNGSLRPDPRLLELIRSSHKRGTGILWQGLPLDELNDVLALGRSNIGSSFQGFLKVLPAAQAYPLIDIDAAELKNIPPLNYYFLKPLAAAQVLATIDTSQDPPALAIKSGIGRVVNIAFLDFWRWQLQSPGSTYRQTINNILTWLSNRAGSSYRAIYANSYFQDQEISFRLRAEDDIRQSRLDLNPRLRVLDSSNKEVFADFMKSSGEDYAATFSLGKAGEYSFEIDENGGSSKVKGLFSVAAGSLEERDHHYNIPLLNWLAAESGGRTLYQSQISGFQAPSPQNKNLSETFELPLYRKWYILALFILSFCVELFFRRRWGLL